MWAAWKGGIEQGGGGGGGGGGLPVRGSGLVSWGDDHEGHGNENGEETGQGGREVGGTLAPNEAAMREPRTPPEPAPITKRSYINSLAMVDRNRCGEWNSETEKRGEEKGDGRGGAGNSLSVTNEYVYGRFSQQYNKCEWCKIVEQSSA